MKVLLCAVAYPPDVLGGGEISTRLLAEGLAAKGVDVAVLTFTDQSPGTEMVSGVSVSRIPCPNIYWSFRSRQKRPLEKVIWHLSQSFGRAIAPSIQKRVTAAAPDIVHTSTIEDFGAKFWCWAKKSGFVTVHTLRSQCLLHRSANMYDAKRDRPLAPDLLSIPKRRASKAVDGVIGISKDILQRHLEHGFFPHARSQVIGNPFEGATIADRAAISGPVRLGVLGRIEPDKGIEPLLDHLRTCRTRQPWQLSIAGTGERAYVEHLKRKSGSLPVTFVGWTDSRTFLTELDLLIIPSRCHEAFGRGVVEAYSVGVPVLCLRRGGLPELIKNATTGWALDDWTTEALENAISSCRQLNTAGMLEIAQQFTTDAISEQYIRFYSSLLNARLPEARATTIVSRNPAHV